MTAYCSTYGSARSRSQLATKRFLTALSQVFGWGTFSSRDVSNQFGLDFLNTSKILSRMSRKPYYLLSVVRVSRPWGGYENSYRISRRGWSKISHLQGRPTLATKQAGGNLMEQGAAAQYLVKGKGEQNDINEHYCFQTLAGMLQPSTSPLDEIGMLLFSFDNRVLPLELFNKHAIPQEEPFRTYNRASYLQRIGLLPSDINLPLFILNAYQRGCSESTILLGLLMRGGIELRNVNYLRMISDMDRNHNERCNSGALELEKERRKNTEFELEEQCLKNLELEFENELLRKKLSNTSFDAFLERSRLISRIDYLVTHTVHITKFLLEIWKVVREFEGSSPAIPIIKSFTHTSLASIGILNYLAISSLDN